ILSRRYRIATTIATVDAVSGRATIADYPEGTRQVTAADVVVVTKRDLVSAEQADALEREITQLNPAASIVWADHGQVDVDRLLAGETTFADRIRDAGVGIEVPEAFHGANGQVVSLALSLEKPLDWPAFGLWLSMLLHRHGDRVLRVKGLLDVGT